MERIPGRRHWVLGLLIAGSLLSALGLTEKILGTCGLDRLETGNEAYLESSFQRSLRVFAVLSTVKVGLAVVEGAEVGVGFGLEVGDAVQAAYDYVDIAWRVVLAGGVILLATRGLLEAASLLDPWLLTATFAALGLMVFTKGSPHRFPRAHRVFREAARFLTVLTAACALLLPLSVAAGAWLSGRITAPSIEEAASGLSGLKEELFGQERTDDNGLFSMWTQAREYVRQLSSYLKEKASELTVWILKLIAGYLFDCLVFPLAVFVLLVWFTRVLTQALFA